MEGRKKLVYVFVCAALLGAACSRTPEPARESTPPERTTREGSPAAGRIPEAYKVRFETSKGPFVVEVHRSWAPLGAERFYDLVQSGYYDGARFFRMVPNFVAQFGLAGDPAKTKKWDKPIPDDPVNQTNRLGSLAFATSGPETRTTQVFINLRSNQMLDSRGFAPFGQVVEGMDVVNRFYSGYGEAPDQDAITNRGNAYLSSSFPKLDYIRSATII